MDNEIRLLASARAGVDELKAELAEVEEELANSSLAVRRAQLEKRLDDMEMIKYDLIYTIRQDAKASFETTGIDRPHPAVTVIPGSIRGTLVRIDHDLSAYLNREESSETADPHTT